MLVAAFGDISGDLSALQAVLRAIDEEGIQTLFCTGDVVVGGDRPNEVLALLEERNIPTVLGDMDRLAVRFVKKQKSMERTCSTEEFARLRATYEALSNSHIEYIAGLPRARQFSIEGIGITLCHGTPFSSVEGLDKDTQDTVFERIREEMNTQLVLVGHTPEPFSKQVFDTLFVNAGAMVDRTGSERVCRYAVVNTDTEPWDVSFRTLSH